MAKTLNKLITFRSQLTEEVQRYLDALAERTGELPSYYPTHLQDRGAGTTSFDEIRQLVQVVEDREDFEEWRAKELERMRQAGEPVEPLAYAPWRSRPEEEGKAERETAPLSSPVAWDGRAGQRYRQAVILGDPGFGKTWLLRYEARRIAREEAAKLKAETISLDEVMLPLFIYLDDLRGPVLRRRQDVTRSENAVAEALVAEVGEGRSAAFRAHVHDRLAMGQAVVLLDAWDEVGGERRELAEQLGKFVRHPDYAGSRLLLTSRIVGYGESPIPGAKELELIAWEQGQIEGFVRVWFGEEEERGRRFLEMLRENHQVQGLARIPLMLALMCRSFQEGRLAFPTRRGELYECCLWGLLREWKEEKVREEIGGAEVEALLEMLAEVAYELFTRGHEQFGELRLRRAIGNWLSEVEKHHELGKENAATLIARLKGDGLLVKAGERRDAPLLFLHRTFQEYLAARYLADEANEKGWGEIAAFVDRKAWDPRCEQVIVLLTGQLEDPKPLLEMLANPEPTETNPYGDDFFRHRLTLAALCLSELRAPALRTCQDVVDATTTETMLLLERYPVNYKIPSYIGRVLPALAHGNGRFQGVRLLDYLLSRCKDQDPTVREEAAQILGVMRGGAATRRIVQALIDGMHHEDGEVRRSFVDVLGTMGPAIAGSQQPHVVRVLTERLQDEYEWVRVSAVRALSRMGGAAAQKNVVRALVNSLADEDGHVQKEAAKALGVMKQAAIEAGAIESLLEKLGDDSIHTQIAAMQALSAMGPALRTEAALPVLRAKLQHADVRHDAGNALCSLAPAATLEEIVQTLVARLRDKSADDRESTVRALGVLGTRAVQAGVLPVLVEILQEQDLWNTVQLWQLKRASAEVLGEMGPAAAQPEVVRELLSWLHSKYWAPRRKAADALIAMGSAATYPWFLDGLAERLQHEDFLVRRVAAEVLRSMGPAAARPDILQILVERLADEEDECLQLVSAEALRAFGGTAAKDWLLEVLVDMLKHEDEELQYNATRALGGIGPAAAEPDVIRALLDILEVGRRDVKMSGLGALESMGAAVAQRSVLLALLDVYQDEDGDLDWAAGKVLQAMGAAAAQRWFLEILLDDLASADKRKSEAADKALYAMRREVRYFVHDQTLVDARRIDELSWYESL